MGTNPSFLLPICKGMGIRMHAILMFLMWGHTIYCLRALQHGQVLFFIFMDGRANGGPYGERYGTPYVLCTETLTCILGTCSLRPYGFVRTNVRVIGSISEDVAQHPLKLTTITSW